MTKQELGRFDSRSIRFTIGSVIFNGAIHHDSVRDVFKIIYSVVEEGKSRNDDLSLSTLLIDRIKFDHEQNTLTLL